MQTRRTFCLLATATVLTRNLHAQTHLPLPEIEGPRIEQAAKAALARELKPIGNPTTEAFLNLTLDLPALATAYYLTPNQALQQRSTDLLKALTQTPTTIPSLEAVDLLAPLAETAVAIPFLNLPEAILAETKIWFTALLTTLITDRTALLARDNKSHTASAWLLLVAALARLTSQDPALTEARHRYKTSTLRAQVDANGLFPAELQTPNPFRNSLLNLDLLAGACQLLSTPFDSVWTHELQDGPGMRAAIARLAPYIAKPAIWPYPADETHFHDLPCRRPALLLAARAFNQPDYAAQWRTLTPAQPKDADILRTFPIRQPILWLSQPKRPTT